MGASTQYRANLDGKFKVDIALRTPHHCGESPRETHQEMTELNSRFYYGLRLLLKCGHFHATERNMSALVFPLAIADT